MGPAIECAPLLEALREDLGFRRIKQGIGRLEQIRPAIENIEPVPGSGVLAGLVAQWVDAGFDCPDLLRRILGRFPAAVRPHLPLLDYLHLRMVEGVVAMAEEDHERAAAHFLLVQSFENDIGDRELLAIANFWIGRCRRKAGQYDSALSYTERAEKLALGLGYTPMAAIMQATLSWLAFQRGRLDDAVAILRRAEDALNRTDDFLNRGNIQSAYARIARRQGRYQRAVPYFERAIAEYRTAGGGSTQLARALQNLAFVQRMLALHAHQELDRLAASRRGGREGAGEKPDLAREQRLAIDAMRAESRGHLQEAMEIYVRRASQHGMAGVHINRGFLYLDAGDLERAALEASEAYAHGNEKSDHIVMARARTLQCIVENAAIEEQVGDAALHHEAAEMFARDAVSNAGRTQNRRLLARACVWQGMSCAAAPSHDLGRARRCYEEAIALLQADASDRQYVWDDLEALKARVLQTLPVDPLLRAWSAGVVEDRSFQQMTEEFARIVIPKVWEREGRKVSRVAEKLSISPKKVRRILQLAGVSDKKDNPIS
jgi:tetratricopeptide (TPR) repeat protein